MRYGLWIGTACVAGAGVDAGAQTATWLTNVETADGDAIIEPAENESSVHVTLSLSMDPGPDDPGVIGFAATVFDTLNQLHGERGELSDWNVLSDLDALFGGNDLTMPDDPDHPVNLFNTNAGQLLSFGPFSYANPIDVFEFTWTTSDFSEEYDVSYMTSTEAVEVWWEGSPDFAQSYEVVEGKAEWTVLPAPGPAAALAAFGLAAPLRRRRPATRT